MNKIRMIVSGKEPCKFVAIQLSLVDVSNNDDKGSNHPTLFFLLLRMMVSRYQLILLC